MSKKKQNKLHRKEIYHLFDWTFCKFTWSCADHEGESGNFTDFIYPVCTESELSIYIRELYNFLQYFTDRVAIDPAWKEF